MLFICIRPSGFFFCLISVISNRHKMTIKGFFNEKKNHFYWFGFLAFLVQLGWSWGEVCRCPGLAWGQSILSHSVTVYNECELGSNGAPGGPAGLTVKEGGGSKAFRKIKEN